MNSYDLSRNFFNWAFDNPELVTPGHIAIYFFAIEHCNRLGWRDKFGLPTMMACEAIGIKKPATFIKYFNDLESWGFITVIQRSKNQYSSNIISLTSATPKNVEALDKAIVKHTSKQMESTRQSKVPIIKPITTKLLNNKQGDKPSSIDDVILFFKNFGLNGKSEALALKFHTWYENTNWCQGRTKAPLKDWKAAARNWANEAKVQSSTPTNSKKPIVPNYQ